MKSKYLLTLGAMALALPLSVHAELVVLPDLSTTVEGDTVSVYKDAAPDFGALNAQTLDSKDVLPELPDSEDPTVVPEEGFGSGNGQAQKEVYAEGLVGGGYPGYFTGFFTLYKDSTTNPFTINFNHVTNNGYGLHPAANGYFNSLTAFDGQTEISHDNMDVDVGIAFWKKDLGLQSKSATFYNINRQELSVPLGMSWELPLGFGIDFANEFAWYSRYSGLKDESASYIAQEAEAATIFESPSLRAYWSNDTFTFGLGGGYTFEHFNGIMEDHITDRAINRGYFGGDFTFRNSTFIVDSAFSFVVGGSVGTVANFLVPYHVGVTGEWPVKYSTVPIRFTVDGGLRSDLAVFSEKEDSFAFAKMYWLPNDSSDWYAKASAKIPTTSFYTIDASFLFAKTAFGNGAWEADYENPNANGLYTFIQKDRLLLDSEVAMTFKWSIFDISLDWTAHWASVPSNEYRMTAGGTMEVNSDTGLWGVKLQVVEGIGGGADFIPFVNLSGYYRINNNMRIALEINDAVKLVTGGDRSYYKSDYTQTAGNAALLFKFFF